MRWLIGILVNAILFMAIAGYFSESFVLEGFAAAITASVLLSIINIIVRPILVILTLPATVLTLGFFLFVINAITLEITDYLMGDSFEIAGFGMALLAAVIMSIVTLVLNNTILKSKKE
ncbi:phage holin family protein [Neobacillus sp. DY30]|uniref:phage holin family protein n=1 Tax=Neobacillus sp. DY30 TaxID=3047871 RepID=UPI0024C054E0|nr:phage holin family protein [Neobacillus sp. DY30]WHX99950.1 phage holin family protein [Neobacillus sp. DY30]